MESTSQLGASTSLPQLNNGPQLLSGSGSFQSYLSSAGSYHRHAKGAGVHLENHTSIHTDKGQSPYLVEPSSHSGPLSGVVRFITNFPGFLLEDLHRFRYGHLGRLRILLSLYCCASVIFLSFKMHSALRGAVAAGRPHIGQTGHVPNTLCRVSPLSNLSVQQRMSIAFPNIAPPGHLEIFTLASHSPVDSDITACLWTEEDKLQDTLTTLTTWPGPMSLVVVTSAQSGSSDHLAILKRFPELSSLIDTHASLGLSFHVLQSSSSGGSANTYLNVARLLAPTDRVVMFPDGLLSHLSSNLYSSVIRSTSPQPLVLGNNSRRAYPFAPMSPVVLPKDYPTWCTERFSLFRSRLLDWEDCLWQLWLESAGEIKSTAVHNWPVVETGKFNNSALLAKLRRRWTVKYRAEACALAMKRAQILEATSYADKKAFQWRKKFCHESLGTSPANAA